MENGIYQFVWRYSRRQQIIITIISIASFPFLYTTLMLPKFIVNDALSGTDFPQQLFGFSFDQTNYLIALCVLLFGLLLINGGFLMMLNTYKNVTAERMLRRLRYMLYQRILRFPRSHYQNVSQGELTAMITAEAESLREFVSESIAVPLFQGGTLVTVLIFMFAQNPILGAAALATFPIQAYVIPKLQRRLNLLSRERLKRVRAFSGRLSETVSGIGDIRAQDTLTYSLADASSQLQDIYRVRYEFFRIKYFMKALNVLLLKMTPLLFYVVGGLLVIAGDLSVGALVAAIAAYENLATPWRELLKYNERRGGAIIKYQTLLANFELRNLLNEKILETHFDDIPRLEGPLIFDKVTAIDEDETKILDNISLEIAPRQKLAIVADAAGRDLLAYTLAGINTPSEGQVRIGDRTLASHSRAITSARIGYAGTDSYVFDGTIGYNTTYGLLRKIPAQNSEDDYDYEEAEASGNSLFDAKQDWRDLRLADLNSETELQIWWSDVMGCVELTDLLFQRILATVPDLSSAKPLQKKLLKARARIAEQLNAEPELRDLVQTFDFSKYLPNASIAANLIFGEARDETFDITKFGSNEFVRTILKESGLEESFRKIGLELAEQLVEIFGRADVDPALLDRFSFVGIDALGRIKSIIKRADQSGSDNLSEDDTAELISLTSQLVAERHRLVVIDDDLQSKIVAARQLFHHRLSDTLRDSISPYDQETYNECLTVRANLIQGRLIQSRANAERDINALIRQVLEENDLFEEVLRLAMDLNVGIGGQKVPLAARQSLTLARALLKRPDILVLNGSLSAHDRQSRDRMRRNIVVLCPKMTLIWIDSEVPKISDFDEVLTLRNGRLEKLISEHIDEPAALELVQDDIETTEIPNEVTAESAVLSRLPLFRDVHPSNLKLLAFGSRRVTFKKGEALCYQGEAGDTAFVILSGNVDIIRDEGTPDEVRVAQLGKNELVGETSLLAPVPRTATARAVNKVIALQIEKEVFLTLVDSDPQLAASVARCASERLAQTLELLHEAA